MAGVNGISLSGSFLSSLLFKLKNTPGDSEGFLFGKVHSHQVDNITDSQSTGRKEERKICLHSFISFNKKHSFYSHGISPDLASIEEMLGNQFQDVIGWFSYRRNSSHRLSLKEKTLHCKLAKIFKHLQSKDFVLSLITDALVDTSTVHSTEYSFQSWNGDKFHTLSSEMVTLPSSMPYQLLPTRLLPTKLTHYNDVLREQRLEFTSAEGQVLQSKGVEQLCLAMLQKLQPLERELTATSEQVRQTSREVAELQAMVVLAEKEAMEGTEDIGVVESVRVGPSTDLLIDIDDDDTSAPSGDLSCDPSLPLTLPPSVDLLSAETEVLVPETLHPNVESHEQESSSLHYQSQELF